MVGGTVIEIKEAIDKIGEMFDLYKKTNDERLEAIKNGNEGRAKELEVKLSKIESAISSESEKKKELEKELKFQQERIEELEIRAKSPGKTSAEVRRNEYKNTLISWIRSKGEDTGLGMKLQDLAKTMVEQKDVTIGSNAGGGYALPEEISRDIGALEKKYSPVRDLVKVVQTGSNDYKELLTIRGTTSGWVGETGSRTGTATPTLREVVPTNGELYAYPQCSEWSIDDIFFNVEQWLIENVAREFALQEGSAVISGNGTTKPTGMLNTTPVTTADYASPLRAAAAYQYIASDLTPGGQGVLPDTLFDVVYTLNSAYRANGSWIMNSLTLGAIRKLKDTTNQYLWQPSLMMGQPDRLLGYPVSTWEQMSDIGANNFPVGFGDWKQAYVLAERVGLRITRDNVTTPGYIKFYVRRREGGIVLNGDDAKFIRTL